MHIPFYLGGCREIVSTGNDLLALITFKDGNCL